MLSAFLFFLLAYILGGLTLLPILLALICAVLFYTSPVVRVPLKTGIPPLDTTTEDETEPIKIYRAGWLTVRRTYEPLNANGNGTYVGMVVSGYRSFMDNRSRDPRKQKVKDQFFAVLKQNVLFLYDNDEQVDCWAAVEITAHDVIIYPEDVVDGELFVKRNSICLKPKVVKGDSALAAHSANEETTHNLETGLPQPWFIFAKVNSDKEDWYHSFVMASKLSFGAGGTTNSTTTTPTNQNPTFAKDRSMFDPEDMARLIEGIDQQPDSIPVRWLNAMLGRIFLSIYRTETVEAYITSRIVRKLKRIKTPSILSEIQVREVNVGSTVPFFSKPMLKELTMDGDASMEVQLSYVGDLRITIETVATINLGSHFKPYSVRLVLAVVLKEIEGTLLLKVKRPPSNRVWFGFSSMPRLVLSVEPVVSTRQIKWSMITSPIEARIREVVMESLVVPHMDDFAFFDSTPFDHRGGIWGDALRKEHDLSTPTGGAGDEAHSFGKDEPIDGDEKDHLDAEGLSTGREVTSSSDGTRLRPRRRRSSDGDQSPLEFTSTDTEKGTTSSSSASVKSGNGSIAPSLAGFSLSSWREGRKEVSDKDKRKSWFVAGRTNSSASSVNGGGSGSGRQEDRSDDPSISASRLRDVIMKRAQSREREQAAAAKASEGMMRTASAQSLSTGTNQFNIAPSMSSFDSSNSIKSLASTNSSELDQISTGVDSASRPISIPNLNFDSGTPIDPLDPSSSASSSLVSPSTASISPSPSISFPTSTSSTSLSHSSFPSSSSSSTLSTRSPRLSTPPQLPPRRPSHNSTLSADSAVPPTMTTSALLASWRTKASDKQAIAAGVAQAKDTMKRWGANWNSRRQNQGAREGDEMGSLYEAGGSLRSWKEGGEGARANASGSTLGAESEAGDGGDPVARGKEESHGDGGAGQVASGGETISITTTSLQPGNIPSTSTSTTIPPPPTDEETTPRKSTLSSSPMGVGFSPPLPAPTTKLSSPIVVSTAYKPATMMRVPGIHSEEKKKQVASDHMSASSPSPPPLPPRSVVESLLPNLKAPPPSADESTPTPPPPPPLPPRAPQVETTVEPRPVPPIPLPVPIPNAAGVGPPPLPPRNPSVVEVSEERQVEAPIAIASVDGAVEIDGHREKGGEETEENVAEVARQGEGAVGVAEKQVVAAAEEAIDGVDEENWGVEVPNEAGVGKE